MGMGLLGQVTIIEGIAVQGHMEIKFGLVLYATLLLGETTILACLIQQLGEVESHPEHTIIFLTAQTIPPLSVRILYSILQQFEVIPSSGPQSTALRFFIVVLMEVMVCVIFLAIGFVDHQELRQLQVKEYNRTVPTDDKFN
jgi:hypothetical protein